MIRQFRSDDYIDVVDLLVRNHVEPPVEIGELGNCFVAISNNKTIGVISALIGNSTKAYVDFLAIDERYRGGMCLHGLLITIENKMKANGVKRYMFHLEKDNNKALKQLYKYREKYDIIMLNDLHYFLREMAP